MRVISRILLCAAILLLMAGSARACINDREVGNAEREFKSSYMGGTPTGEAVPDESSPSGDTTVPIAVLGTGSVLLLGAMVISLKGPRARS